MRILVADSWLVTRQLIINCLAGMSQTDVVQALDGEEALKLLEEKGPFDLVITDWLLDKLAGLALIQAIQAKVQPKRIPIIVLADIMEQNHALKAVEDGVSGFIIKPFQVETLQEKIRACLKPQV